MAGDEASAIHSKAFPPTARLHRPSEFAAVLASPLRSRAGSFELRYCLKETGQPRRLGLVIPKRLARQAVLRNRIKRVAREAFRHQAPELAGIDIVVRLVAPIVLQSPASGRTQMRLWRRQVDGLLASISPRQTP